MLPRAATLVAMLALVFMPTLASASPACAQSPPQASQVWPLQDGIYFYVGDAGTTGFWQESNHHDGLQITPCAGPTGSRYYDADTYLGTSVPQGLLL
jgi:hypothetical protein